MYKCNFAASCQSGLALAHICSCLSNFRLVISCGSWKLPWWEYLQHRNHQLLQNRIVNYVCRKPPGKHVPPHTG